MGGKPSKKKAEKRYFRLENADDVIHKEGENKRRKQKSDIFDSKIQTTLKKKEQTEEEIRHVYAVRSHRLLAKTLIGSSFRISRWLDCGPLTVVEPLTYVFKGRSRDLLFSSAGDCYCITDQPTVTQIISDCELESKKKLPSNGTSLFPDESYFQQEVLLLADIHRSTKGWPFELSDFQVEERGYFPFTCLGVWFHPFECTNGDLEHVIIALRFEPRNTDLLMGMWVLSRAKQWKTLPTELKRIICSNLQIDEYIKDKIKTGTELFGENRFLFVMSAYQRRKTKFGFGEFHIGNFPLEHKAPRNALKQWANAPTLVDFKGPFHL